jgi:hypothetical protein
MDTELSKKIMTSFMFVIISFALGWVFCDVYRGSFGAPQKAEQFIDKERSVMIFNLGISLGYLSSKQGINEELLYSEGMKMYNLIITPKKEEK